MTPEQINEMVAKPGGEKMKANPDDMQGWLMLGPFLQDAGPLR
jgi:cytochrome c-type biogenesis protein CcmH